MNEWMKWTHWWVSQRESGARTITLSHSGGLGRGGMGSVPMVCKQHSLPQDLRGQQSVPASQASEANFSPSILAWELHVPCQDLSQHRLRVCCGWPQRILTPRALRLKAKGQKRRRSYSRWQVDLLIYSWSRKPIPLFAPPHPTPSWAKVSPGNNVAPITMK